jgi:SOS-response transcriptional repressor LexA
MSVQYGMTEREAQTYRFIRAFQTSRGFSPSFEEIKEAVGYRSRSRIFYVLKRLEERGLIRRVPAKTRSITLTKEGYQVILSPELAMRLESHAQKTGDPPEAVISDAIALHLDSFDEAVERIENMPG